MQDKDPTGGLLTYGPLAFVQTKAVSAFALSFTFTGILFTGMALAQLMNQSKPEGTSTEVMEFSQPPPEIEEFEEPPPPPPEEEPPPPELEQEPPQISLDALELALSGAGSGGDVSLNTALPGMSAAAGKLDAGDILDIDDLDDKPRVLRDPGRELGKLLSRSSRTKKFLKKDSEWEIKVTFIMNEEGEVDRIIKVEATYPELEEAARKAVEQTKMEPGTRYGKPVPFRVTMPFRKKAQ